MFLPGPPFGMGPRLLLAALALLGGPVGAKPEPKGKYKQGRGHGVGYTYAFKKVGYALQVIIILS